MESVRQANNEWCFVFPQQLLDLSGSTQTGTLGAFFLHRFLILYERSASALSPHANGLVRIYSNLIAHELSAAVLILQHFGFQVTTEFTACSSHLCNVCSMHLSLRYQFMSAFESSLAFKLLFPQAF